MCLELGQQYQTPVTVDPTQRRMVSSGQTILVYANQPLWQQGCAGTRRQPDVPIDRVGVIDKLDLVEAQRIQKVPQSKCVREV